MRFPFPMVFAGLVACAGPLGGDSNDVGDSCTLSADCPSNMCLPAGAQRVCTDSCRGGADCPSGWSCDTFGGVTGTICLPPPSPDCVDCEPMTAVFENGVSVRTLLDQDPVGGIELFFNDVTGALLGIGESDADGRASLETGEAVTVTAVYRGRSIQIFSISDVEPGERIVFETRSATEEIDPGENRPIHIDVPGAFPGADKYDVTLGCVGGLLINPAEDAMMAVNRYCYPASDPRVNVLVTPIDANRNVLAYAFANDVSIDDDGTTMVNLQGPWRTDLTQSTLTVRNDTAAEVTMTGTSRLWKDSTIYGTITPAMVDEVIGVGSEAVGRYRFPDSFGHDFIHTWFHVDSPAPEGLRILRSYRGRSAGPVNVEIELDRDLPPEIGDVSLHDASSLRPEVRFVGGGDDVDVSRARIYWSRGDVSYRWDAYFEPGIRSYRYPESPESVSSELPDAGAYDGYRALQASCDAGGYDGWRSDPCGWTGFHEPDGRDDHTVYSYAQRDLTP